MTDRGSRIGPLVALGLGLAAKEFLGGLAKSRRSRRNPVARAVRLPAVIAGAASATAYTLWRERQGGGWRKGGHNAGSSSPNASSNGATKRELYEQARKKDIPGRGSMSKDELIKALSKR